MPKWFFLWVFHGILQKPGAVLNADFFRRFFPPANPDTLSPTISIGNKVFAQLCKLNIYYCWLDHDHEAHTDTLGKRAQQSI